MNEIAKTWTNFRLLAPTADKEAGVALDAASNLLFRDYPAMPAILEAPLPPAMRARLDARRQALVRCLAPAAKSEHSQMAAAISGLLGDFGGASGSAELLIARYVHMLKDLPLWAVAMACDAIGRGEVDGASLDFRPAVPRLRQVVRSLMAPWDEELFRLREVLRAEEMKPEDAEMRKRIGALMGEFSQNLKMGKFKPTAAEPEPPVDDFPAAYPVTDEAAENQ